MIYVALYLLALYYEPEATISATAVFCFIFLGAIR